MGLRDLDLGGFICRFVCSPTPPLVAIAGISTHLRVPVKPSGHGLVGAELLQPMRERRGITYHRRRGQGDEGEQDRGGGGGGECARGSCHTGVHHEEARGDGDNHQRAREVCYRTGRGGQEGGGVRNV